MTEGIDVKIKSIKSNIFNCTFNEVVSLFTTNKDLLLFNFKSIIKLF